MITPFNAGSHYDLISRLLTMHLVDEVRRVEVRREDDEHVERDLDLLARVQREVVDRSQYFLAICETDLGIVRDSRRSRVASWKGRFGCR